LANKTIFKREAAKHMASIPQKEITSGLKELSSGAYRLLTYLYSRGDNWIFSEKNTAIALATSPRQVAKYRRELIELGYLHIERAETVDLFFVGKGAVSNHLNNKAPEEDSEDKEPLITRRPKRNTIDLTDIQDETSSIFGSNEQADLSDY